MSQFLFEFPYRTKDGYLEPKDCIVVLDSEKLNIQGQLTRIVFDPVRIGPVRMTGLFLRYEGVEYGSISMNLVQLNAIISSCACAPYRIHVTQFVRQFV